MKKATGSKNKKKRSPAPPSTSGNLPESRAGGGRIPADASQKKDVWEEREYLRYDARQMSDIIENLPDATFVIDAKGVVIAWNRAIEAMTGVKKEEMIGKGNYEYALPFYGSRRPILIDLVFSTKEEIERNYSSVKIDGSKIFAETFVPGTYQGKGAYLSGNASPLFDNRGNLYGAIESIRDITEQKRADNALRESQTRLISILQGSPIPKFVIDKNHHVIHWNKALEQFSGITADKVVGTNQHWRAFYQKERPTMADLLVDNAIEKIPEFYEGKFTKSRIIDEAYEATDFFPHLGQSGSWLFFTAAPILDPKGTIIGAVETLEDISNRRRAEEEIRTMSRFQESIISNANVWLMVLDDKGKILLWNKAAVEISGYSSAEVVGNSTIWKSLYPDHEYRKKITANIVTIIQTNNFFENLETTIRCRDGQKRIISWNTRGLMGSSGGDSQFIAIGRDITSLKRAEETLLERERLYNSTLNDMLTFVAVLKPDGEIVFVNNTPLKIIGRSLDEVRGMKFYDVEWWTYSGATQDLIREDVKRCASKEMIYREVQVSTLSGMIWIDFSIHPVIGEDGNVQYLIPEGRDITERKKVEDALAESEERYREVVEDQTEFICRFTPDGTLTFVNDAYCRYFGLNRNECIGKHHSVSIPPDDARKMNEHIKALTPENPVTELRHRITMPDGQIRWQRWSDRAIFDKNGHVVEYQSVGRDITDIVKAEEVLQETKNYLENLIQYANSPIIVWNPSFHITEFNHAFETLTGMTRDEAIGKHLETLFPDTTRNQSMKLIRRALGGEHWVTVEIPIRHASGDINIVLWNSANILSPDGTIIATIAQGQDITERKRVEEEIRTMIQFQESIISNANVWLMVLDEKGNILLWNNAAADISGYPADEVIGTNRIWKFLYPEGDYRKKITDTLTGIIKEKKFLQNFETTINCKSGEQKIILWNTRGLEVEKGKGARFVAIGVDITKSIKAEQALRESEERYREVVEDQTEFICRFTPDGTLTFVNDAYCRYFGLNKNECIGKHHSVSIPPDDARKMNEHIKALTPENPVTVIEHRIIMPSGEVRWQRWNDRALFDNDGRVVEYQSVGRDMTEQKRAEESLRQSEEKFRNVLENVPDLVLVHRNGVILYVNPAMIQTMEYTPEEVINTPIMDYIVPEYHGRVADAVRKRTTASIEPYEIELLTKGGGRRNVIVRGTMIEFGGAPASLNVLTDITERKQSEAALRETEERYRSLFDRSLDCVYIHDFEGKFIEANPSALKLLGYTGEEIRSVNFTSLLTAEQIPLALNVIQEVIMTGTQKESSEYRVRRRDGTYVDVETTATLLYHEGKPYAIQGFAHDITERKMSEERLKKFNEELERGIAERTAKINASLEEKVVLLREIHHRVKNNLQIIISLLNLQSRYIGDESVKQIIRESQNRLKAMSLVHEKLYMSPDISKIDFEGYIGFLARNLFDFYGVKRQDIAIKTDISGVSIGINTAIPIGLVVNELISNSLKYAFPDGRKGEIAISVTKDDSTLSLLFKDNGVGIPEDMDWRNAKSLGLRIVVSLVDQLSGTIELNRTAGTAFTIVVKEKE